MFAYDSTHEIRYSNKDRVPLKEVAKSLLGFEKVILELPLVMNALVADGTIRYAELFIDELSTGSLIESFVVRFFFQDEKGYHQFIDKLRDLTGMSDGNAMKVLVTGLIAGATVYGLHLALPSDAAGSARTVIEGNQNTVIQFVAETLNVDSALVESALQNGVRDKKSLAEGAVETMKAAKLDPEAQIEFDRQSETTITAETVRSAPSKYEKPIPEQRVEEYARATVQIRATDRDNGVSGWKCIVPGVSEARVKLVVDPSIDLEKLGREVIVVGDIAVTSRYDAEKKQYRITEVMLRGWEEVR